jgi:deoxyhypusine synthase
MTEYNYFCWSKEYNDGMSFQQKRYRVFNVEVSKEEYESIDKIYNKLEFDPNERYGTRYATAFKKMRD